MRQFATHTIIFALILLIQTTISAQITLEATYPTTDLRRISLPISGEKWYYVDDSARQIRLFNANHSPWKTVNFPTEINKKVSLDAMNMPVSETIFNRDSLLEFVWRFTNASNGYDPHVKILNERNDSVYYFPSGLNYLTVNELEGSSTKLFVENRGFPLNYTTSILSLPSMLYDTTYVNARDMRRERFSHAGEKYYFKKIKPNKVEICNANFKNYKTVSIPIANNTLNSPDPAFFVDDKLFNSDTSVEYRFSYHHADGPFVTKIVDEAGLPLIRSIAQANSYSNFVIDSKIAQPNKLIFNEDYSSSSTQAHRSRVYSLPERQLEGNYPFFVERVLLKYNGAKYVNIEDFGTSKIYKKDHTLWKTINLIPTPGSHIVYDTKVHPLVSDSIVNQDSTLEVIWTEYSNATSAYQLRITTENETNLATVPSASSFQITQLSNLPNKLVTKMSNGFKEFETKVWRFSPRTPVNEPSTSVDFDVQISPNPFTTSFTINNINAERPLSIKLFDALGRLILTEKMATSNATLTPPITLPNGIYLLELIDGQKRTVKKIVKI